MMAEFTVTATIWLSPDDVDEAKKIAQQHDVQAEEATASGLGPLLLVPLVITGAIAAVALAEHEIEVYRGGQVIDLTGAAPKFFRSKGVQYGLVVVLKRDGSITVDVKQPKELIGAVLAAIQGILTDIGKEALDQAAKAIKAVVGDKGTVTARPGTVS
jgi:hypothetical protein